MASAEDAWVAAFEQCRGSLALFSKAQSAADLAAIKDGWTLCLGAQLCKKDCKKWSPRSLTRLSALRLLPCHHRRFCQHAHPCSTVGSTQLPSQASSEKCLCLLSRSRALWASSHCHAFGLPPRRTHATSAAARVEIVQTPGLHPRRPRPQALVTSWTRSQRTMTST